MNLLKKIITFTISFFLGFDKNLHFSNIISKINNNRKTKINFEKFDLFFYVPNKLIKYRVKTLKFKEPEIIKWIDNFEKNKTFYDVGANIGLYSCYAAKQNNSNVYSFEPSVFNLENLAKNVHINDLVNKVTIIPNPLYKNKTISKMKMSSIDLGGAISTFAEDYTFDGSKINSIFSYNIPGLSLDELIDDFLLPYPDYLKIDVDGIEHLILKGGKKTLRNLKSIFIEVSENFLDQKKEVEAILSSNDFIFDSKYSDSSLKSEKFQNCFNQIWFKKNNNVKK